MKKLNDSVESLLTKINKPIIYNKIKSLENLLNSPFDTETIGFLGRSLIQATLPHSKTEGSHYTRTNGNFKLNVICDRDVGLPYGIYPRILLYWLSTEIVRNRSREIELGKSLSDFMQNLGIVPSGGKNGTIQRFRDQLKRLFSMVITCTYEENNKWSTKTLSIADETFLWWDDKESSKGEIIKSKSMIKISEPFYEEILNKPVPIDIRAVKILKGSAFALDLYFWLTYRSSYLKKETYIPLTALFGQFGVGYENNNKGRYEFKRTLVMHLKKIKQIYKDINYKISEDDKLILHPSKTHIRKISK
jgi:hypothetical protein